MNPEETMNVSQILSENTPFGQEEIQRLDAAVASSQLATVRQDIRALQAAVDAGDERSTAVLMRLGISLYLLGELEAAERYLSQVSGEQIGSFYHALVLTSLDRHAEAEEKLEEAKQLGYDPVECTLRRAGAVRALGRLEEAETLLRSVAKHAAGLAEYSFQMGCIWADRGDTFTAVEYFERAVDMDPHHSRALFWLAAENSRQGNDDEAIRLYEQSLSKPPHFLGALLNLGLLYEDRERYSAASYCFRRVVDFNPNHERALLYLKDIDATSDMFYDEDSARREARLEQLLSRPISDFELSVRSRNCLESMNIYTLGHLTNISEQELLAGKNFGETSLHEIRDMLTAHGLSIGQYLHQAKAHELMIDKEDLTPQEQSLLSKPVAELNFSVRARKCMGRLGITSVGMLVSRSADELLSSRNFGVTSLNEVRAQLSEIELKLRND